jgi:hypothetical protein
MSKETTVNTLTHVSIEERGRQWAKDYLSGRKCDLNKLVLVIPKKDARVMALPPMMGDNFALRLDDLGSIFGQRWREISIEEIEITNDKWQLLYPSPDRVQADYLTDIPQHKTGVAVWQPVPFKTIESAIRAQGHVIDKVVSGNENSELTQASQVISQIDNLAKMVLTKKIDISDLDSLSKITEQILIENNLINVEASRKVLMAEMLKKAFNKDSLNRINPLVMRTRLRSAYIRAIRQLVLVSKVAEKYTVNRVQLEYEREINRWALQETATLLERKLLWHEGFERHRYEPQTQLVVLEAIMQAITASLLTIPRVKPYLAAARVAGMALIGCRPEHVDKNRLIINDERTWYWLGGGELLSVVQMVRDNNFQAAEKRVEEIKAVIDNVLQ